MTPRTETRSTKATPQRPRTSARRVLPFPKVPRSSGRGPIDEARWAARRHPEHGEPADWPLLVFFLTVGFIIAARRVGVAIRTHEVFGIDATLAFVFVLGTPLLLREPLARLLGQVAFRIRSARH
jgi:hypothetical protein